MLANRHDSLLLTLMLGVGLLSGCEEEPAETKTMFPDGPNLDVGVVQEDGAPEEACVTQCCGVPADGKVVVHIDVTNWVLAPHEECGDEPQCGPVVVSIDDPFARGVEIETVEPTVTFDVRDLADDLDPVLDADDPLAWRWRVSARVVPREPVDYPGGFESAEIELRDETGLRARDYFLCNSDEGRFTVFAEVNLTTPAGAYVARASFDDVEVVCEFEVVTDEEGLTELVWPPPPCTPAGVAAFYLNDVSNPPEVPIGTRRLTFAPRETVERASLAISRDGEVLVQGSKDVAGELTSPAGLECTIVPCQIAESLGLTL